MLKVAEFSFPLILTKEEKILGLIGKGKKSASLLGFPDYEEMPLLG